MEILGKFLTFDGKTTTVRWIEDDDPTFEGSISNKMEIMRDFEDENQTKT